MPQFKISEAAYKKSRKKGLAITIPIVAVIAITVTLANSYSHGRMDWTFALIFLPLFSIFITWAFWRTYKRQRQLFLSYTLTVSAEGVTREQDNTPTISISFMEIKDILKSKKGNFVIKGIDKNDLIYVPRSIDNPEEVEQLLQQLAPVKAGEKDPFGLKYRLLLTLIMFGAAIGVLVADNKILVTACGAIFFGLMIRGFYVLSINKNASQAQRRSVWIYLIWLAIMAFEIYLKLTA